MDLRASHTIVGHGYIPEGNSSISKREAKGVMHTDVPHPEGLKEGMGRLEAELRQGNAPTDLVWAIHNTFDYVENRVTQLPFSRLHTKPEGYEGMFERFYGMAGVLGLKDKNGEDIVAPKEGHFTAPFLDSLGGRYDSEYLFDFLTQNGDALLGNELVRLYVSLSQSTTLQEREDIGRPPNKPEWKMNAPGEDQVGLIHLLEAYRVSPAQGMLSSLNVLPEASYAAKEKQLINS